MDLPEWIDYQAQFDLSAEYFQDIPEKSHKHCVIVEHRSHERLIIVIKNFMYLLQKKGWGLTIFHSKSNAEFIMNGLAGWPNVQYILLDTNPIFLGDHSSVLSKPDIWRLLLQDGCIHALVFNVDTVLLKDNVDDFLEYDYIGAPQDVKWSRFLTVFNGGLSIRDVRQAVMITQHSPRIVQTPVGQRHLFTDDIFFSFHFAKGAAPPPSLEIASKFAIESVFHDDPCGIYRPNIWRFPNYDDFIRLLSKRYIKI
jgi:hypothetical protein